MLLSSEHGCESCKGTQLSTHCVPPHLSMGVSHVKGLGSWISTHCATSSEHGRESCEEHTLCTTSSEHGRESCEGTRLSTHCVPPHLSMGVSRVKGLGSAHTVHHHGRESCEGTRLSTHCVPPHLSMGVSHVKGHTVYHLI